MGGTEFWLTTRTSPVRRARPTAPGCRWRSSPSRIRPEPSRSLDEPGGDSRVRAAVAMLTDRCPQAVGGGTQVWLHGPEPWIVPGTGGRFTALLSRLPDPSALSAGLSRHLARVRTHPFAIDAAAAEMLRGITPPFAVVSCAGPERPVIAATDLMGCRHCTGTRAMAGPGSRRRRSPWPAARPRHRTPKHSRSAACSAFISAPARRSAASTNSGPAVACALRHGRVQVTQYAQPWQPAGPAGPAATRPAADRASSVVRLLRACGEWSADEFPDAVIELSGGLDSRIQLAAIPPYKRAGLRAMTLDNVGTKDGLIGRQLRSRHRSGSPDGAAGRPR